MDLSQIYHSKTAGFKKSLATKHYHFKRELKHKKSLQFRFCPIFSPIMCAHSLTHLLAPKLQLAVIAGCDITQTPSASGYLEKSHFIQFISGITKVSELP